jgi:hypothetical protein
MKELRTLSLGILLGGIITYSWLGETSSPKIVTIVKEKECVQKEVVIKEEPYTKKKEEKTQQKEDSNDRETNSIDEPLKTPDELYAEAHEESYSSYDEEPMEEDRTVMPLELIQAENEVGTRNEYVPIDRSIISEEQEQAEAEVNSVRDEDYAIGNTLPLEPEIEDEEELKEVMPESLIFLEEYGDGESQIEDGESEIPL